MCRKFETGMFIIVILVYIGLILNPKIYLAFFLNNNYVSVFCAYIVLLWVLTVVHGLLFTGPEFCSLVFFCFRVKNE